MTVPQFFTVSTTSNYLTDDRDYAIHFLNIINSNNNTSLNETNLDDVDINQLENVYLNQREKQVCYYIAGYNFQKICSTNSA